MDKEKVTTIFDVALGALGIAIGVGIALIAEKLADGDTTTQVIITLLGSVFLLPVLLAMIAPVAYRAKKRRK